MDIRLITLVTISILLAATGCVPQRPSDNQVIGSWRAKLDRGITIIYLRGDSTYYQQVGRDESYMEAHSGRWSVAPSGKIVLRNAYLGRDPDRTGDLWLESHRKWGRTILTFDPSVAGYQELKSGFEPIDRQL